MVGLFMISFLYQGHTYYANVIRYGESPLTYFISIINASPAVSKKLIVHAGNDGFELSIFSPSAVTKELLDVIATKLPREVKVDVA